MQQFSLGVQQQYGSKWSSEINYVGNVGSPLLHHHSTRTRPSITRTAPAQRAAQRLAKTIVARISHPGTYKFASISLSAPVANSSYHSLQATLARRFDQHFSVQASFVWSKVIGYGALTNAYDLNSSRGVVDIDVPYNFVASYIFVSPEVHHLGLVGTTVIEWLADQWHHDPRSGQPFNVTSGVDSLDLTIVTGRMLNNM